MLLAINALPGLMISSVMIEMKYKVNEGKGVKLVWKRKLSLVRPESAAAAVAAAAASE